MNDKRFAFIATVTTIILSIIIAGGITSLQSYSGNMGQGIKTSIHQPENERLLVPLQNMYESKITQESKNIQISSTLRSPVQASQQIAPKLRGAFARTNHPSAVIRTQKSNITIFPQLNENETHPIFSINLKSQNSISKITSNSKSSANSLGSRNKSFIPEKIAYVAPTFTTAAYNNRFYTFYKLE